MTIQSTLHSVHIISASPTLPLWAQGSLSAWLGPLSSGIFLPLLWLLPVGFKHSHPIPDMAPSYSWSPQWPGGVKEGGIGEETWLNPKLSVAQGDGPLGAKVVTWGTLGVCLSWHPHSSPINRLDSPMPLFALNS